MSGSIRLVIAACAAAGLLSGCGSESDVAKTEGAVAPASGAAAATASSEAALAGFRHTAPVQDGYYVPQREVKVGNLQLTSLAIGPADEFTGWEGGRRTETYGPVMLMFDDVSSPMAAGELGESRSVTVRVLPSAYDATADRIRFAGEAQPLGAATLDGRIDAAALAAAVAAGAGDGTVMTADLTLGVQTFDDVPFSWTVGE